jgi:hypothetical protein
MSGADLFVVCKNCQSEVSPYVTECPYCGARLRKRAPKLEPGAAPPRPRRRPRAPSLGRLRPGEIPGIRVDARPLVTIALVLGTCGVWIGWRGGWVDVDRLAVFGPLDGEWWRVFTTQFVFLSGFVQFFSLLGLGLFGWLVERRWGWPAVLAIFLAAGAGGTAIVALVEDSPVAIGGTGAALGLLCAWAVPELLARRRSPWCWPRCRPHEPRSTRSRSRAARSSGRSPDCWSHARVPERIAGWDGSTRLI